MADVLQRIAELEALLEDQASLNGSRETLTTELHLLYRQLFIASNLEGIVEEAHATGGASRPPGTGVRNGQDPPPRSARPVAQAPTQALLSIVVPAWNVTAELADMTVSNLTRMWEVSSVPTEVIVIDNASPHARELPATLTVRNPVNRGVAPAWNAGAALARGRVIAFVNTDVEVERGWDETLYRAALDGRRIAFPYTDHGDGLGPRRPDQGGTAGWCFALSQETRRELGRFDEGFAPAFFEDTDYWHRAWEAGIELSPVPAALVRHVRRTSARNLERMDLLLQGNRMKYGWKHGVSPTEPPPFHHREIVNYRSEASTDSSSHD